MKVRIMQDEDFEKVLDITKEFNDQTPYPVPFNRQDASTSLKKFKSTTIVAEDNDKIVGVLILGIAPIVWNFSKQQGIELCFYVHPEYRTSGVGKQLIQKMEMLAQLHGLVLVTMFNLSSDKDKVFERYYNKLGYKKLEIGYTKEI